MFKLLDLDSKDKADSSHYVNNDDDKPPESLEGSCWSSIRSLDSIAIAEHDVDGSPTNEKHDEEDGMGSTLASVDSHAQAPQIVLDMAPDDFMSDSTSHPSSPSSISQVHHEPRRRISFLLPESAEGPVGSNNLKNRRMSTPAMPSVAAQQRSKPSRPKIPTLKILSENLNALDLKSSVPLSPTSLCKPKDAFTLRLNPDVEEILAKLTLAF